MPFRFVDQPFKSGFSLGDFFDEVRDSDADELDLVTAWVKRSGVNAIAPVLDSLRSRGVRLRAIVGISLGGTSRQGLEELLTYTDELYVYQHPGRTFHPKMYRAASAGTALTFVGSHNLTAGGVANNFEAGTFGILDLSVEAEQSYHADLLASIDRLAGDASAHRVDATFIDTLVSNDRYVLIDESASRATGDETGTRVKATDQVLFGKSDHPLGAYLPPRAGNGVAPVGTQGVGAGSPVNPLVDEPLVIDEEPPATAHPVVVRRWFKELGRIDAQQGTSANWNPSNTATLVESGHPIRRETYFRDEMFVDLDWQLAKSRGGKEREVAELVVEVITDAGVLGRRRLELRHTPDYDSNQSNRTTELQWGELSGHMRSVNHFGDYLTLERLSDGSFRLFLTSQPPGPFKK